MKVFLVLLGTLTDELLLPLRGLPLLFMAPLPGLPEMLYSDDSLPNAGLLNSSVSVPVIMLPVGDVDSTASDLLLCNPDLGLHCLSAPVPLLGAGQASALAAVLATAADGALRRSPVTDLAAGFGGTLNFPCSAVSPAAVAAADPCWALWLTAVPAAFTDAVRAV